MRQNDYVLPTDVSKQRSDFHLLDVREQDEWDAGHLDGSQHIPLGQLATRLDEVPHDRTVVAVCRSGSRSDRAAKGLRARGYTVVRLGDPSMTPLSHPGVIDLATSPARTNLLEVYCLLRSAFIV